MFANNLALPNWRRKIYFLANYFLLLISKIFFCESRSTRLKITFFTTKFKTRV